MSVRMNSASGQQRRLFRCNIKCPRTSWAQLPRRRLHGSCEHSGHQSLAGLALETGPAVYVHPSGVGKVRDLRCLYLLRNDMHSRAPVRDDSSVHFNNFPRQHDGNLIRLQWRPGSHDGPVRGLHHVFASQRVEVLLGSILFASLDCGCHLLCMLHHQSAHLLTIFFRATKRQGLICTFKLPTFLVVSSDQV